MMCNAVPSKLDPAKQDDTQEHPGCQYAKTISFVGDEFCQTFCFHGEHGWCQ
jgi:hypothetical protein